jgi:lysozyme family protein
MTMSDFQPAFERTLKAEGGYKLTDIQGDRGGQTYAGIARKPNPHWPGWAAIDRGQIPPSSLVRDFYKAEFWDKVGGDDISSDIIASTVYDFAVNAGWRTAVKLAQIVVGQTPDGVAGPQTIAAMNAADPHTFALAFALAKIRRYAEIVNRDRSQSKFLLGWVNRTLEGLS